MRILGIDPGSRFTGWGLLQREGNRAEYLCSGTLRLAAARPLPERLLQLSDGIEALLAQHAPDHAALEQIFTAKNARSALVLGHARGVIVCAVARRGIALHEYTAGQVKQAVVGAGRASKEQVQRMVTMLLGRGGGGTRAAPLHALQEDEADALAVALTHAAALRTMGSMGSTAGSTAGSTVGRTAGLGGANPHGADVPVALRTLDMRRAQRGRR